MAMVNVPLSVGFGVSRSGQAEHVGVILKDKSLVQQGDRITEFEESPAGSGTYERVISIDTDWLPVTVNADLDGTYRTGSINWADIESGFTAADRADVQAIQATSAATLVKVIALSAAPVSANIQSAVSEDGGTINIVPGDDYYSEYDAALVWNELQGARVDALKETEFDLWLVFEKVTFLAVQGNWTPTDTGIVFTVELNSTQTELLKDKRSMPFHIVSQAPGKAPTDRADMRLFSGTVVVGSWIGRIAGDD